MTFKTTGRIWFSFLKAQLQTNLLNNNSTLCFQEVFCPWLGCVFFVLLLLSSNSFVHRQTVKPRTVWHYFWFVYSKWALITWIKCLILYILKVSKTWGIYLIRLLWSCRSAVYCLIHRGPVNLSRCDSTSKYLLQGLFFVFCFSFFL